MINIKGIIVFWTFQGGVLENFEVWNVFNENELEYTTYNRDKIIENRCNEKDPEIDYKNCKKNLEIEISNKLIMASNVYDRIGFRDHI